MPKPILNLSIALLSLYAGVAASEAYAEPVAYEIDDAHTHIIWQVERFGFTNTVGTFSSVKGYLWLDEENPENNRVEAEIPLSGLKSDLAERENIIRGSYWLDAETFPTITFTSNSVELIKSDTCPTQCANVAGIMSLKGVEAPLVLNVVLNKQGKDPVTKKEAVGFRATGSFKRSQYNIPTALGPIGDDVNFQIEVLAIARDE